MRLSPEQGFAWSAELYAGYKHCLRLQHLGEIPCVTRRPILLAGLRPKLCLGRLYIPTGAKYNLLLKPSSLHTLATQRLGLKLALGRSNEQKPARAALLPLFGSLSEFGDWDYLGMGVLARFPPYSRARAVSFDSSGQSEDLIDLPVLVPLTPARFVYAAAHPNGT